MKTVNDDPQTVVSPAWLAERLGDDRLKILDGSWYLPSAGRDWREEFAQAHIPNAQFFDVERISDPNSPLPHTAPPDAFFAEQIEALGISSGDQIVVYDGHGLFSAARVRWHLRFMGLEKVAVLNGGFVKWRAEGHPVSNQHVPSRAGQFSPMRKHDRMVDFEDMCKAVAKGEHIILDARSEARFRGDVPEMRAGVKSGHIPGSFCLPFMRLLNEDGTFRPVSELRALFAAREVEPEM